MKCFCPGTRSLWVCAVITSQGCWWGCKNLILLLLQGHCGHVPALLYSPLSPGSRWVLSTKYKILFWTCQRCFPCQGPSWVLSRASVSFSYRLYRCQSHPESRTLGQKWRIESKNELYSPKRVCTFFYWFQQIQRKELTFLISFQNEQVLDQIELVKKWFSAKYSPNPAPEAWKSSPLSQDTQSCMFAPAANPQCWNVGSSYWAKPSWPQFRKQVIY